MAGPAVRPAQHDREHSEGDDECCHKEHFSCRHDLLLLLPIPADMLAERHPVALIRINSSGPPELFNLTQVNLARSTFRQTDRYHRPERLRAMKLPHDFKRIRLNLSDSISPARKNFPVEAAT